MIASGGAVAALLAAREFIFGIEFERGTNAAAGESCHGGGN